MILGVTGGIGSGKSLVCKVFEKLGVPVYEADARAKQLMQSDAGLVAELKQHFGEACYAADGSLDRRYLAQHVFFDPAKLQLLNSLVHPAVARDFKAWVEEQQKHSPLLVKEAALLLESGGKATVDKVLLVTASEPTRIRRVLLRDPQRKQEEVQAIIGKQMPESEKRKQADYIIENEDDKPVFQEILRLHSLFVGK